MTNPAANFHATIQVSDNRLVLSYIVEHSFPATTRTQCTSGDTKTELLQNGECVVVGYDDDNNPIPASMDDDQEIKSQWRGYYQVQGCGPFVFHQPTTSPTKAPHMSQADRRDHNLAIEMREKLFKIQDTLLEEKKQSKGPAGSDETVTFRQEMLHDREELFKAKHQKDTTETGLFSTVRAMEKAVHALRGVNSVREKEKLTEASMEKHIADLKAKAQA